MINKLAVLLAAVFTRDLLVSAGCVRYVRIIAFGYGMMEIHRYCGFILTGMHRPILATDLNLIRVGVFLIPLASLGSRFFGVEGIFAGRLFTDLAGGAPGRAKVAEDSLVGKIAALVMPGPGE